MNKSYLEKLDKSELIELLLKQNAKPIPKPRKSVKQMVQDYEENIILPPPEFSHNYKPVPSPRTKKTVIDKPVPLPRTKKTLIDKPVPLPRTEKEKPVQKYEAKIYSTKRAFRGFTKSYEIMINSEKDPLVQLQSTREGIEKKIKKYWVDLEA